MVVASPVPWIRSHGCGGALGVDDRRPRSAGTARERRARSVSMKKTPIEPRGSARRLARALCPLDEDLRRRGAAEKTRERLRGRHAPVARWASWQHVEPAAVSPAAAPLCRRLTERGRPGHGRAQARGAARVLRDLASTARSSRTRPTCSRRPSGPRPAARPRGRRSPPAGPHPRVTPLELRDRALFELAYACGLRAEELVKLDLGSVDFDAEESASRARAPRRAGPGRRARAAGDRPLPRAGSPGARDDRDEPALFLSKSGRRLSTSDVRRRLRVWARKRRCRAGAPARAASLLRHAPAGRRRGPEIDPGAARTRVGVDDADLHSGRVRAG